MQIFIATGTHKDALNLATQLRVPRTQWAYVATPDQLHMARSALVLVDDETLDQHPMAEAIANALYTLHANGTLVVASLAPAPPTHFRD